MCIAAHTEPAWWHNKPKRIPHIFGSSTTFHNVYHVHKFVCSPFLYGTNFNETLVQQNQKNPQERLNIIIIERPVVLPSGESIRYRRYDIHVLVIQQEILLISSEVRHNFSSNLYLEVMRCACTSDQTLLKMLRIKSSVQQDMIHGAAVLMQN